MGKYVLKRALLLIPTIFIVLTSVFILLRLAPGDPAREIWKEEHPDEGEPTNEQLQELRDEMGLNDPMNSGRWNGIKRIIVNITMAVIAACLAPALINWLFTNMGVLSQGWRTVISALVSTILLGGGVAFFVLLSGLAVGQSVIYVAVKFFIVGAVRLAGSYVFLMLLLLAWQNRVWTLFTGALSGFLAVMVLMAAVELMIDSMFGN